MRTDLGGIYFHLIFALVIIALSFISGYEILLAVVTVIIADILYQCLPYVRLDGYWALADLTGIPDFFSQMGPFLRSVLPIPGLKGSELPNLKPWVKGGFALYITLTIPVLAILFFLMVMHFPRFMAVTWGSLRHQTAVFSLAQSAGDLLTMAAVVSQVLLLTLSMLAAVYFLYNVSRKPIRALWSWSKPTQARRITGALTFAGVITFLAFL